MGVRIIEGQRTQPACISVEFEIYLGLFIIYDFQLNPYPTILSMSNGFLPERDNAPWKWPKTEYHIGFNQMWTRYIQTEWTLLMYGYETQKHH